MFVLGLGLWMRFENGRRDREQGGLRVRENQVDTSQIKEGEDSVDWRFFT